MAEIKGFQDCEHVVPDVESGELLVQSSEVHIACVNVLHDQCWCLRHGVTHDINQVDDVDAVLEGLKDLNFTTDLGLFDFTKIRKKVSLPGLRILMTMRSLFWVLIPS